MKSLLLNTMSENLNLNLFHLLMFIILSFFTLINYILVFFVTNNYIIFSSNIINNLYYKFLISLI